MGHCISTGLSFTILQLAVVPSFFLPL